MTQIERLPQYRRLRKISPFRDEGATSRLREANARGQRIAKDIVEDGDALRVKPPTKKQRVSGIVFSLGVLSDPDNPLSSEMLVPIRIVPSIKTAEELKRTLWGRDYESRGCVIAVNNAFDDVGLKNVYKQLIGRYRDEVNRIHHVKNLTNRTQDRNFDNC